MSDKIGTVGPFYFQEVSIIVALQKFSDTGRFDLYKPKFLGWIGVCIGDELLYNISPSKNLLLFNNN